MSPRRLAWLALVPALTAGGANLPVQISVDPGSGRIPISPYIYGVDQDLPGVPTPGARRYGGNRLTGYDWETNASNAGTDYLNESDDYLVYTLPSGEQSTPAIALTAFHDQSLAAGVPYTILTLQMAGYVAADEAGPVAADQAAPSSRWNIVSEVPLRGTKSKDLVPHSSGLFAPAAAAARKITSPLFSGVPGCQQHDPRRRHADQAVRHVERPASGEGPDVNIDKIDHVAEPPAVEHVPDRASGQRSRRPRYSARSAAHSIPRRTRNTPAPASPSMNAATRHPCPANIPKATPVLRT